MKDRSVTMHSDQEQEFELVLGNKQLFSLLFLVFVLLGVFFAMGYAMGRNSAPADVARQTPAAGSDSGATPASRPSMTEGSAPPPTIPASEVSGRPVETQSPAPPSTASVPAQRGDAQDPARFIDPKPGEVYLQVSAVARPEAELLVEVLSRKGFRASMAPGPSENVIRVLVGPTSGDSELTKMRTDLEQAGFKAMVRRY